MDPRLISVKEASQRIGVSKFFLYGAHSSRREPFYGIFCKVGGRLMVSIERLDRLVDDLMAKKHD